MGLPTFIVIGPGRSGSTWLYEALDSHPDVCMAKGTKNTVFFQNGYYKKGISWYESFFADCDRAKAVGEVSNTYFYNPDVAARIHEVIPDVTLISCLRDPIDRIQSVYLFNRRNGRMQADIDEALRRHSFLIEQNRYWTLLQNYLKYFDRNQVHVVFYEDLEQRPRAFAQQVCEIIGVNPNKVNEDLFGERVNAGAKARHWLLGRAASWVADVLRRTENHALLNTLKRNDTLRSVVLQPLSKEEKSLISPQTRTRLLDEYEPEIHGIEQLTGRDLSHWRST